MIAAILFHFIINISQEILEITQITKCIETVLLSVVAVALVALDKEVFPAKTGSRLFREGTIGVEMVDNG